MMVLYILCVSCCGICIHLKGGVLYCVEKKRFILICTYIYFFYFFPSLTPLLCLWKTFRHRFYWNYEGVSKSSCTNAITFK